MIKKIGIVTLPFFNWFDYNYGGVLQNYALKTFLSKMNFDSVTIRCDNMNSLDFQRNKDFLDKGKRIAKWHNLPYIFHSSKIDQKRFEKFERFISQNISPISFDYYDEQKFRNLALDFDYFVVGSDQVWRPIGINEETSKKYFLEFASKKQRISYAASIADTSIPDDKIAYYKVGLSEMKSISVREKSGANILKKRVNIDSFVNIDPVLLLNSNDWEKIESKPSQLDVDQYIVTYFLGKTNKDVISKINNIANENKLKIINIMDKKSDFYSCDPSEFIYLINHSKIVCTDSFHATVFSIIFNKPVLTFKRTEKNMDRMYGRISDLFDSFGLDDRLYEKVDNEDYFNANYSKFYEEISKSIDETINYFNNALN